MSQRWWYLFTYGGDGGHCARVICWELRFASGMRRVCVRVEVKREVKTWQWGAVLSEVKREVQRKAGVNGKSISQRRWLMNDVGKWGDALQWIWRSDGMLVDVSVIMEVGPADVWSIFGAPDGMRWLSAGETRVKTYMWGAGKRSGMLTPYGGSWSWRGKLRTWRIEWKWNFSRDMRWSGWLVISKTSEMMWMIYISCYLVRERPEEIYESLNIEGWNLHFTKIEFWVEFFLDFDV